MCEQCLVNPLDFGEPLEGWILMRARRDGQNWLKSQWGLIEHDDPTFTWYLTPTPSPIFGMTTEQEDAWLDEKEKNPNYNNDPEYGRIMFHTTPMFRAFSDAFKQHSLDEAYRLVNACVQKGYNSADHGDVLAWLFDYLGEYIQTAEIIEEEDVFPQREKYHPTDYSIGRN